ncbi:MAG: hypothetical protein CMJ83_17355 [Planctomycetes bacterium]|nr:hypothetical protein [Planctomycetota bacterium]
MATESTNHLRSLALGALLAASILGGCQSPPSAAEHAARLERAKALQRDRSLSTRFAAGGHSLVDGIPAEIATESFWPGDRLLYGIESMDVSEVERFYLLFETLPPEEGDDDPEEIELVLQGRKGEIRKRRNVTTRRCRVSVKLLDAEMKKIDEDPSTVYRFLHEAGLFAYARRHLKTPKRKELGSIPPSRVKTPPTLNEARWGSGIFGKLFAELQDNDALFALARRLSVSPGFFELPRFLGGSMELYTGLAFARIVDQPIAGLPVGNRALECPMSLWRHGHPVLSMKAVYVPPVGPLAMAAGVVTVTGYRKEDPGRRFVVRLLGIARGSPTGSLRGRRAGMPRRTQEPKSEIRSGSSPGFLGSPRHRCSPDLLTAQSPTGASTN